MKRVTALEIRDLLKRRGDAMALRDKRKAEGHVGLAAAMTRLIDKIDCKLVAKGWTQED